MDTSRPVFVLGGAGAGTLGLIRSLGKAGIPVHLLSTTPGSFIERSRYAKRTHEFPSGATSDKVRISRLADIARDFSTPPPIFTGGDEGLRFLSNNRESLSGLVELDLAPKAVVDACLEKDAFAAIAEEFTLPVPQSWTVESLDALQKLSKNLDFPVFLKPTHTRYWQPLLGRAVQHAKGCVVETRGDLLALFDNLAQHGTPESVRETVIQEYVAGPDDLHYSVNAYRQVGLGVTRAFVGRKVRVHPPHAGLGVFVVSESQPDLVRLSCDILDRLAYSGIADLDYKRDARTGEFKLLEINCRYSMWNELPMRAGCNMAIAGYAAMTGQALPVATQRDGIAWFDLKRDAQSVRVYRREAGWSWTHYLWSLLQVRSGAVFALDDLGPIVHNWLRRGRA